jgi:hypothetical protein
VRSFKFVCQNHVTWERYNCTKLHQVNQRLASAHRKGFWNAVSERVAFFTICCGLSIVARSGTQ